MSQADQGGESPCEQNLSEPCRVAASEMPCKGFEPIRTRSEKDVATTGQNKRPKDETSDSFDRDGANDSQATSKPKHVRRLRLNSSHLLSAADKSDGLLKPVDKKLTAPEDQSQVLVNRENSNNLVNSSGSSSQQCTSSSSSLAKYDKEKSTSVGKSHEEADIYQTPALDVDLQGQTKSPLMQRSVSSPAKENAGNFKQNENVINSRKTTNSFALHSPETDKAGREVVSSDLRSSNSFRGSARRAALQEVLGTSSSNSSNLVALDNPLTAGARLRDRSKMKSPADLLEMRQYPEIYLGSAKKSSNSSFERSGVKSINGSAASPSKLRGKLSVKKGSSSSPIQLTDHLTVQNSRKRSDIKKPKFKQPARPVGSSKISVNRSSESMNSSNESINKSSKSINKSCELTDKRSRSINKNSKSINKSSELVNKSTEVMHKRSESVNKNSKSINKSSEPTDKEAMNIKANSINNSSKSINKNSKSIDKSSESVNKISVQDRPDPKSLEVEPNSESRLPQRRKPKQVETDKSQELNRDNPQHRPQSKGDAEKSPASKANQSLLSKDSSGMSSDSSKENSGGRSLRNRREMATPESLQEKRQYPVSFYSSKTRENILNTSVSKRSKSLKQTNQPQSPGRIKREHYVKQNKGGLKNKSFPSPKQRNEHQDRGSLESSKKSFQRDTSGVDSKLSRKGQKSTTRETSRRPSAKTQAYNLQAQVLSIPQKLKKGSRLLNISGERQAMLPPEDNHWLPEDGQCDDDWDIQPVSANSVKNARPWQTRVAHAKRRTGSTIDDTVLTRNKVHRKRKLVEQLSQEEPEDDDQGRNQSGKSRKILLWCPENQSRSASDVTAYDVIFQAAVDVERDLSQSAEDLHSKKLVKQVFTGFKNNMKSMIAQNMQLKMLEKEVRERKRKCKILWKDVAEKRAESARLKQEIAKLETNKNNDVQRISNWMRDFTRLSQMVLDDKGN
ncbi:hypothetical protein ElyMa_003664600 [Elysia marginata]|uniref:MLF1-interacting protein n=1 Tax=Elysia marginata TaxID=1093978 RepID=A0AAV4EX79_9GAST|nr:hypothetical protein ElyMa_003664600 [Elysia marginata]